MIARSVVYSLIALVGGTTLASCTIGGGATRLSAIGSVRVTAAPINVIPSTASGASALIPIDGDLVVVERTGEDFDSLSLTRLSFPSTVAWRIPISVPAAIASVKFEPEFDGDIGYVSEQEELIHHFFRRGNSIVLISSRYGYDDAIDCIVRHFDLATGKELLSNVVASLPQDDDETGRERRFMSSISPDSLTFTLTNVAVDTDGDDRWKQTVAIVNLDGSIVRTRTHFSVKDDHTLPRVLAANRGQLYFVSLYDTKELRIVHVDERDDSVETRIPFKTPDDERVVALVNVTAEVGADGSLTCALTGWSGNDFVAAQIMRYDRAHGATVYPAFSVSEELTAKLVNEDEIDDGVVVDMVQTSVPSARYILVVEGREIAISRDKYSETSRTYGSTELMLLAFDGEGRPTWQRGIAKESWALFGYGWQYNSPVVRAVGNQLELLSRNEKLVVARRYDLATGVDIGTPPTTPTINFDSGEPFTLSTLWSGPSSFYSAVTSDDGAELIHVEFTYR